MKTLIWGNKLLKTLHSVPLNHKLWQTQAQETMHLKKYSLTAVSKSPSSVIFFLTLFTLFPAHCITKFCWRINNHQWDEHEARYLWIANCHTSHWKWMSVWRASCLSKNASTWNEFALMPLLSRLLPSPNYLVQVLFTQPKLSRFIGLHTNINNMKQCLFLFTLTACCSGIMCQWGSATVLISHM